MHWTKQEADVMREHYDKGFEFVATLLPNRTYYSIRKKAKGLGLTRDNTSITYPHWPVPAMDLHEQLWCVKFRKWAKRCVQPNPRFGVAMIGGGYV